MQLSTEAKVGAVTLIGLLLLAFMIMQLGVFTFGEKGYPIQAVFSQVGGLKEGNVVRYSGVEVGHVRGVQIAPDGVQVTLIINPGVKIPEGSKFSIGTDGLLGEKFVNIAPPPSTSGFLSPRSVVRGEETKGLEEMMASADKVLADLQKLLKSFNEVMGDENVKAAFKDTVQNAQDISANLKALSATLAHMAQNNEGDVNVMVSNLRDMSGSLRTVAARVDKMMADIDNNGQTAADLREAIENLKSTSLRVEKMANSLEGVVTDPETSQNIKETLRNARDVSEKANKMLKKAQAVSTQANFEILYNTSSAKYRSNADVRINTSPRDFAVIGVSDIGDGSKTNFQIGKGNDQFASRAGVIDSKAGVGVDTKLGSQLRLSLDVYDPNDVRVKLRTQYQIAPDTFLVGQTDSLNKQAEKNTYVGLRRSF
ncbi:MAG TPA: MlaD family protein [Negativicutes bacterium]|jgi:phospholipid/cholesterol/gamma-HCH transport system substrate-binding protein